MFTGLVTAVGTITESADGRVVIRAPYSADTLERGESIACNGVCLTVVDIAADGAGSRFAVELSPETLARTAPGGWKAGRGVNLERALRLGDALGGHLVTGHVDGLATVLAIAPRGEHHAMRLEAPESLARFLAPKGSVTLDGVSLTVNEVEGGCFGVNLIPHTRRVTTLGKRVPGDRMNLEVDLIARYVERLLQSRL